DGDPHDTVPHQIDDDEVPTTPDGESGVPAMPSDLHLADEAPTDERPLPPPRSSSPSHTAVVPPLSHSALRTYLAAIIAAVTVAAVTLLVLRPWARGGDP